MRRAGLSASAELLIGLIRRPQPERLLTAGSDEHCPNSIHCDYLTLHYTSLYIGLRWPRVREGKVTQSTAPEGNSWANIFGDFSCLCDIF